MANVPYLYITYSGELFKPSALMIKIYIYRCMRCINDLQRQGEGDVNIVPTEVQRV